MALSSHGDRLFVANRNSGSISVIDIVARTVIEEQDVGTRLSALAAVPNSTLLLALDEGAHELILLSDDDSGLRIHCRVGVGRAPVDVQVTSDGSRCLVASLWARQVTAVRIARTETSAAGPRLSVEGSVELPFAPRKQILVGADSKLIVADSFGGRLAVVDAAGLETESLACFQGCNVRGLTQSPDGQRLLVAHQQVNPLAHSSRDDLRWALLVTNVLRFLDLAPLLLPKEAASDAEPTAAAAHGSADARSGGSSTSSVAPDQTAYLERQVEGRVAHLGEFGHGTGDPAGVVVTPSRKVFLALAGVNEVAVADVDRLEFALASVGTRPTCLLLDAAGTQLFVANTFSDSVSILNAASGQVEAEVRLGPTGTLTARDEGELLFFDARVSLDGWMSCHSCHTDGHTNGLLSDTMSDGSFGTPKNVLSLLGVTDTQPWAWNGRMAALEEQVQSSLVNTMHSRGVTHERVERLAAYLRSLEPAPPLSCNTSYPLVAQGADLFERLDCGRCHAPPTYTTPATYDVGLADEQGARRFNPPSLRGVSQRQRFFHDGRARSLEELFTVHLHQLRRPLADQERAGLVAFLKTL
jgi:YVTN family beta-propeller protein